MKVLLYKHNVFHCFSTRLVTALWWCCVLCYRFFSCLCLSCSVMETRKWISGDIKEGEKVRVTKIKSTAALTFMGWKDQVCCICDQNQLWCSITYIGCFHCCSLGYTAYTHLFFQSALPIPTSKPSGITPMGDGGFASPALFPEVLNHLPTLAVCQRTEMERTSVLWVAPLYMKTLWSS